MNNSNLSDFDIRKWYLQVEDTLFGETGAKDDGDPLRKIVIAACIRNPFAGKYEEDLSGLIKRSPELGKEFGRRIQRVAQGEKIESYGKACLVGIDGEYEHGNALLTNIAADPVREALGGGRSWVPSTGKRGGPGTMIDIPLAHKDELYVRSHYDTVSAMFSDGPNRDEVVIIWAFATRGRLNARLGGLQAADVKDNSGLH